MNLHALYHRSKSNYSYCYDSNTIHIRFRAAKQDLDQVTLIYGDKYEWAKRKSVVMERTCSDELYDYFTAAVTPEHNRLAYFFEMVKGEERLLFSEWGAVKSIGDNEIYQHFFQYPYLHGSDMHAVPEWVKHAVFYQIFPERFLNGDKDNDPKSLAAWGSKPTPGSFYGGDLRGIIEKIDYLEELGINAVYMTPIFEATTNHKYDTTDYFKIDPAFGDLSTLKELVAKCHSRGIKVVLDAVFNHSGYLFAPFQDVIEKGPESQYYDWFHIHQWPFEEGKLCYDAFAFAAYMPKLNTQNPKVRDYLLEVGTYWIKEANIDGWRLDVSDEVDHEFWKAFRKAVKSVKPDAYIIGENWLNSLPWLMGDQFDAVMNYPFTRNCLQYFAYDNISETQFKNHINTIQMNHTQQVNEVMLNLLDSHDTARFLTIAGNDKNKVKLAAAFQFTYIGTPCVYYGTEIGMEGGVDPDCRRTMEWDSSNWDREMMDFYRRLIHIRREHQALRTGSFNWVDLGNELIAYERKTEDETVLVVINKHQVEKAFEYDFNCEQVLEAIDNQIIEICAKRLNTSISKQSVKVFIKK